MRAFVFIILLTGINYISCSQDSLVWVTKYYKKSNQILEKYQVLKSDSSIKHGEYFSFYKAPKVIYKKNKHMLNSFKKANGYFKYGQNDSLWFYWNKPKVKRRINYIGIKNSSNSEGKYKKGGKVGIWKYQMKEKYVYLNYNHDSNLYLLPNIETFPRYKVSDLNPYYDSINGDEIIIEYEIDSNCNLLNYSILKTLHPKLNYSALEALKEKLKLTIKYRNKGAKCIAGKHKETFFYEY
jgi:hypothetical protein